MSKKGKIIMGAIIVVLIAAVIIFWATSSLMGGAKKVDFTEFSEYVQNAQYYTVNEKGERAPNVNGEGEIVSVSAKDDANNPIKLGGGYYVNDKKVIVRDLLDKDGKPVVDGNGKTTQIALNVIWKVKTDAYQFVGEDASGKDRFYCFGSSVYGAGGLFDKDSILSEWQSYGVHIDPGNPNAGSWVSTLFSVLMIVAVGVVFFLIIRSSMGGSGKIMSFAKTKARVSTNIKVRFDDVAGAEEEKVELAEVVEFLRHPKKFSDLGARIPKGVLLVGPPGTGKTLFAKAVAGEAGVPFFSVSGSDFVEMYVGVGASRVRDLFDMAKKNQPCIIFIDEIDAVGRHRGAGLGGGNDEREQTLNQILVQMDGFESNEGVIVMAATNRADILDPALMRPGRFDRQVFVNLPDVKGREQILKVHARNKPLATDVNFKTVARMTAGFSGADLANLLNEAAILAARANKKFITNAELYEGINKVLMGPQKKSHVITESDKRITAYHEAGHAILATLCEKCDPVQEVTIIPRGRAAGYTLMRPDSDDHHVSRGKLLDQICMGLGGRVAEELVIQDICTGASGDIEQATEMAKRMVTEWGMSQKLGLLAYGSNSQTVFLGKDMETHNAYSDETAKTIDEEMRAIIEEQHSRATELLSKHRSVLDNMARVLIERETIYTDEVEMLLRGKSYEEVLKFMDEQDEKHSDNPFKKFEAEKSEPDGSNDKPSEQSKTSTGNENVSRETKPDDGGDKD